MYSVLHGARKLLPLLALVAVIGLFGSRTALAAGVVGNGTPGSCTQSALDNALTGGGTVTFNCGANPVTITLAFYEQITASTVIDGGNKITLNAPNNYHFQINAEQTVTIKNIILTGGKSTAAGSIENFGKLIIAHVTFIKNKALNHGGAILNHSTLIVKNSTLTNNSATNGGGAIWNDDGGTAKIKNSTFKGNKVTNSGPGGAIGNNDGTLTVVGGSISSSSATDGGAIYTWENTQNTINKVVINQNKANTGAGIENFGYMDINLSTISNNTATIDGGAIWQYGQLGIDHSTVSGNSANLGAGMFDTGDGTDIEDSTFYDNHAVADGGALYTNSHPGIRNSTLSGNSAGSGHGGGAVYATNADVSLQYVTVANNTASFGGGVNADSASSTTLYMQNVVLSNNTGGNCDGAELLSGGHNLSSDNLCANVFTQKGDKNNKNALLGPLASNGGPTKTHLPLAGSPLINKGYTDNHITLDQRGYHRPVGSSADIGAVEVQ